MKTIVLKLPDAEWDALRGQHAASGLPITFRPWVKALLTIAASDAESGVITRSEIMEVAGR